MQGTRHSIFHFVLDDVKVNVACGNVYGSNEKGNREAIWTQIRQLDQNGQLKKTHLDQFAIDLYESTCLFMNMQVKSTLEAPGEDYENFLKSALRLARAWRQSCLSSRDVQFNPLNVWLIMLNAVYHEINKSHGMVGQQQPGMTGSYMQQQPGTTGSYLPGQQPGMATAPHQQGRVMSTVKNVKNALKELFKGHGARTAIAAAQPASTKPAGLSMKAVFKEFLTEIYQLDQLQIIFTDIYDESLIPNWIKEQRPLVLDPVNPWNNTVYNLHKHVSEDLKRHALDTLKLLEDPGTSLNQVFHLATGKMARGA